MVAHSYSQSPSFRQVANGLVELHLLIKEGREDSPEADAIRDALDAPLQTLSRTERERAQWLSEDLYSVSEPSSGCVLKEMNPQAQEQLVEALEARQQRQWDRALELLRRWKDSIAPALMGYIRGSIWLKAGNPRIATVFYQHASQCDPSNVNYRAMHMNVLAQADPDRAGELAAQVLANPEDHSPVIVASAAAIRFNEARTSPDAESIKAYHALLRILEKNVLRLNGEEQTAGEAAAYTRSINLLGGCHEFLGNREEAVRAYSAGLHADPDNDLLLMARGILLYGSSPLAIADLEQAVRLDSPMIWPHLFLAHHYLITNQFELSRASCEMGLAKHGSDTARSLLEEWRAIAQAELGFPPESVRAAFEAAVRTDPSNDLAKRNRDAFEASLTAPQRSLSPRWERKTEAAVRQYGLVERRYALAA